MFCSVNMQYAYGYMQLNTTAQCIRNVEHTNRRLRTTDVYQHDNIVRST